jgi:elongation factor P
MILEVEGGLFQVHDFTHVTPGKGQAVIQTRLRNLHTGSIADRRFRSSESVEVAHRDNRAMQYLYKDGDLYTFMDMENYEQVGLGAEKFEDALPYLMENMEVTVAYINEQPMSLELPGVVEMEVVETDPAVKGATAAAQTKPATLETGLVVQVPPFVNPGDRIRVDTSSGEYLTRA